MVFLQTDEIRKNAYVCVCVQLHTAVLQLEIQAVMTEFHACLHELCGPNVLNLLKNWVSLMYLAA